MSTLPSKRIISASYARSLSIKHGLDSKMILNSLWFKKSFPEFEIDSSLAGQNQQHKFITSKRGFRFSTSVGGTLTGEGGDLLIIDDPHNPAAIFSNTKRRAVKNWFEQSFASRLDDKKNGAMVLIMQRLHEDDLTAHLLSKSSTWQHLNLPFVAMENEDVTFPLSGKIIQRKQGDLLNKNTFDAIEVANLKKDLGNLAFSAQYQQAPQMLEGGMCKRSWLKFFDELPEDEETCDKDIYISWDTAIKTGLNNDFSACTVWYKNDMNNYYLIDAYQLSIEYPFLKQKVKSIANFHKAEGILIEDKASGQSLIQELKKDSQFSIIPIMPKQDKITRFAQTLTLFEAGKIFFPSKNSPYYKSVMVEVEKQLFNFPVVKNDDFIDSISQFLNWSNNRKNFNIRFLE